jgi:hypothetical protein
MACQLKEKTIMREIKNRTGTANKQIEFTTFSTHTRFNNAGTNLAHIQGIIVTTTTISIGMDKGGVLPCLGKASIVEKDVALFELFVFCKKRKKNNKETEQDIALIGACRIKKDIVGRYKMLILHSSYLA